MEGGSYDMACEEGRVYLTIRGYFNAAAAADSIVELERLVEDRSRGIELVTDLAGMTGYDRKSRHAYQGFLERYRDQISLITLIGTRPVFRMVASALCLYAGINMRFVKATAEQKPRAAA
ncbi:MAG: hypothetical protein B7733_07795 [Myxococcales bacterium FL481]|nr:MAG: hypothetical protein B7733_07795 [Myxococcales bacterium FL481]